MRRLSLLLAVCALSSCSPSPSSSPLAFCVEVATRYCDQQISCSRLASSHRVDCINSARDSLCIRPNESNRALLKLNDKLTTQCLASIKSTGCAQSTQGVLGICLAAVEPAVATSGKCETDSHCRTLGDRCIGVGCERTCLAAGAAGQPCRPGAAGVGTCNTGLTCDASGVCSKGGTTGVACSGALPCDPDNFCDPVLDTCAALPTVGQACRFSFPSCASAAFCALGNCAARVQTGATCLLSNECVAGDTCRNGTCQALAADGAACTASSDCAAGLSCDNVSLTCRVPTRVFFEDACSSTQSCYGVPCRNLKPARLNTAGAAGTCGFPAAGDLCFSKSACPAGTLCVLPATAGEPGTCTAVVSGAKCTDDSECLDAEACSDSTGKCTARISLGGSCADVSCVDKATCVRRGAAQICVEAADLNATCSNDMVAAIPCRSPLICARTSCISAGRQGEACFGSGTSASCLSGSCLDGICGPRRPDGATCKADSECVNGACERGICIQECR